MRDYPVVIHYSGILLLVLMLGFFPACSRNEQSPEPERSPHDLSFPSLAERWDEGIPLGNGTLGALIWRKNGCLRLSIDRIDLWDLRLQQEIHTPDHNFKKIYSYWENGEYDKALRLRDRLRQYPYPTKIPGGALEFAITSLGEPESVHLYIKSALCEIRWNSGTIMQIFIHSAADQGWFRFSGLTDNLTPELIPPAYHQDEQDSAIQDQNRGSLLRLGYSAAEAAQGTDFRCFYQQTSLEDGYSIGVKWRNEPPGIIEGVWTITRGEKPPNESYPTALDTALEQGFKRAFSEHLVWWHQFWQKSRVSIPDPTILTQWYREMYKFGACTGTGSYPISLQSVWTADNGSLPPWAGDFHHDLNTQLSYWPAYAGNHLAEARTFVDWLWQVKPEAHKYTRNFFQSDGLAFPGVTDIKGRAMGGWWQYSHNPATAAWLGHHFYCQWRYSMDREFLSSRAYPWIKECAEFFTSFSDITSNRKRNLPLSSSPEINDDRADAWFPRTTNFDLALIRWTYSKAAELARELELAEEAEHWSRLLQEWPELSLAEENNRLLIAPAYPLPESHRHFSHLMAIHPLGLFDLNRSDKDREIIVNSIAELDRLGTQNWVGYSFSWLANLKARAGDGAGAAEALRIFAQAFCSPNTFHLNGDQTGQGYSRYRYRPFTLEGNFAFAAGLLEMLVQSQNGLIRIFPAVPPDWQDVSFSDLRTEGAFLVSAKKEAGFISRVEIRSEKGGELRLANPFAVGDISIRGIAQDRIIQQEKIILIDTQPGDSITILNKKEPYQ